MQTKNLWSFLTIESSWIHEIHSEDSASPVGMSLRMPAVSRAGSSMAFKLHMEQSASFRELLLYVEDIHNKVDVERRNLFQEVQKARHLIDEANGITRVVRPEDHLHIEVEFVWDIMRETDELIMIRVMRDCITVLHHWTYANSKGVWM